MKYNTKPIDYTGCHPVIAEHLKQGEEIKCRVWDYKGEVRIDVWIYWYNGRLDLPYRSETGASWKYAEPISRKVRRIMPPKRAIPILIAEGWAFTSTGSLAGPSCVLAPEMYALMGGDVDDEANEFAWPPCIIEEVEDDE